MIGVHIWDLFTLFFLYIYIYIFFPATIYKRKTPCDDYTQFRYCRAQPINLWQQQNHRKSSLSAFKHIEAAEKQIRKHK